MTNITTFSQQQIVEKKMHLSPLLLGKYSDVDFSAAENRIKKSLILAIVADLLDSIVCLRFPMYIISIIYCIFCISFIEAVFTWDSFFQAFPFSLPISPRHHKSDNIFTENKLADGKFSYICVKLKCGNFSCTRMEAVICYCRQVI